MLGLFGSKDKKIEKHVTKSVESLKTIVSTKPEDYETNTDYQDACEELDKRLNLMVEILEGKSPDQESCDMLAKQAIEKKLMLQFIENLHKIEFEDRKRVVTIFNVLVRKNFGEFAKNYLLKTDDGKKIISILSKGYKDNEIALNCGTMLRECIKHEDLHLYILSNREIVEPYFTTYLHDANFDIASDAFSTVKDLLTENKTVVANYLNPKNDNFKPFFDLYNKLLESKNYVTQRQGLKILGDVLLDRTYYDVMMAYICETKNLILIMNLLRLNSPAIQFEAFHVFKVLVANPNKPADIANILKQNCTKLIAYLEKLLPEKEDEQFLEEKKILITTLKDLEKSDMKPTA